MASGCCPSEQDKEKKHVPACHQEKKGPDWFLWSCLLSSAILYAAHFLLPETAPHWTHVLSHSVHGLINTMWWGILLGIVMVAVLGKVPREFVISVLGSGTGVRGVVRATCAGVLLDLCSHGILMVGAKLYERGASAGQLMAFLIASPWNSFSLTLILIALIGLPWTLAYILLSMVIAVIVGVMFDALVNKKVLPENPAQQGLPEGFRFVPEAKKSLAATDFDHAFIKAMIIDGVKDSRMVLRWIFFGVLLASLVRVFFTADDFQDWFGPTFMGLMLTVIAATIIEVCSEGSTPIAADLVTRANAPGNGFAFLMTGVSTDYTEVMVLKETTRSWKMALFLPLLTVPQVLVVAYILNQFSL